jgi:hypothetical protein
MWVVLGENTGFSRNAMDTEIPSLLSR